MPLDYQSLMAREFPVVEHAYGPRETILYALGIGLGFDPLDPGQLAFTYENGLKAVPAMVNILAHPGFWPAERDSGIDWRRILHAEQSFVLQRPLAPAGRVTGQNRITALYDKGADKGALLCQERKIIDAESGMPIATVSQVSMLRGDGGFGGPGGGPPKPHAIPPRPPDVVCDLPTLPQAALIYRLNGDFNPLHADPAVAAAAGFSHPILHGLCTMGIACHALLRAVLQYDPAPLRGMRVRFTAPVFPGEAIRTEMWVDGSVVSLRCRAIERNVVVLDAGRADIAV